MVYKSFYTGIIIIGLTILGTAYLTGWLMFNSGYIHTIILLHILFVFEFIWLITFVNKTNRMLGRFFASIHEDGTSIKFESPVEENTFKLLSGSLNNVIDIIRKTRFEKEREHNYLKYIIEHINTGILSLTNNNSIDFVNQSGLKILGVKCIFKPEDFQQFGKKFYHTISNIKTGEHQLVPTIINKEIVDLSVRASEFKLFNNSYKIISFHDIRQELDQKEVEAWQKAIKILAHEILSSVSPIRSLSEHLNKLLEKDKEKYLNDTIDGLKIIYERSDGLMSFVKKYRQISDIPSPVLVNTKINDIFYEIKILCQTEFEIPSKFKTLPLQEDLTVNIDKNLFTQSIINIIRNSVQAVKDKTDPEITIEAYKENAFLKIKITDNGVGIDKEDLENIFIPFFTTKKGGSGIGLTIAKQLTIIQGGRIEIFSEKGIGTSLIFSFELID